MTLGPLQTNCYLVADTNTGDAIVVDPADDAPVILSTLNQNTWHLNRIVLTHGHFDHIGAAGRLREMTGARVAVHSADVSMIGNPAMNLSIFAAEPPVSLSADDILEEGSQIRAGQLKFRVSHTPGHSPGSICLIGDEFAMVGDLIFRGSVGRTDFPNASHSELMSSIRQKLYPLDDRLILYPGHGPSTELGFEKRTNPYLESIESKT